MSYPPYGGGPPGGYPPAGGYGQGYPPSGGMGMPTPESASAAAYGGNPGGMPYPSQPGGDIGFNMGGPGGYPPVSMPSYGGAPGYPPAGGGGYPPSSGAPGYPAPSGGPGYPSAGGNPGYPGSQPGYGQPPSGSAPGGYGQAPGYGQPPAGSAPGYGQPPAGSAPGYGQPPAGGAPGGYGQQQQGGYGQPPASSAPGGYGQPPAGSAPGGYGQAPPGGAPGNYGGYGNPGANAGYSSVPGNSAGYGGTPPSGPASYHPKEDGTLKANPNFNVEQDVQVLRKAMKGAGTDERAIIDVLGYRTADQRQNIKLMYKTCFGRDLMQDLRNDLSGRFENVMIGLLYSKAEYDAYELKRAMRGAGTDEAALIEILCTRSNADINAINDAFKMMYKRKLEEEIISETSGHFKKLLVSMTTGGRLENQQVDQSKAMADAQRLYQAGEKRWGTDENTFNMVLASQSYPQLRAVFDSYSKVSKKDIEKAISNEMSGDVAKGMRTIVRVVRDKPGYFAERLYYTMKGAGTDDRTLIRIVVTRCEIDMVQIKQEFQRRYGKTLESFVRDDVSGDYKKIMLALIGGVP